MIRQLIGRAAGRLLGIHPYTDADHLETLEHARVTFERVVGTCGTCGTDLRLLVGNEPKRVVCDCGDAIPSAVFALNERRHP